MLGAYFFYMSDHGGHISNFSPTSLPAPAPPGPALTVALQLSCFNRPRLHRRGQGKGDPCFASSGWFSRSNAAGKTSFLCISIPPRERQECGGWLSNSALLQTTKLTEDVTDLWLLIGKFPNLLKAGIYQCVGIRCASAERADGLCRGAEPALSIREPEV